MSTIFSRARTACLLAAVLAVAALPACRRPAPPEKAPAPPGGAAVPAPGPAAPKDGAKAPAPARVGEPAPDFTLADTEGKPFTLSDLTKAEKVVVLEWFNPDCPFVQRHHKENRTMVDLWKAYGDRGVAWLAVNSGAPGKQGNGLERNREARREYGMEYPVLLDEEGKVGRLYAAKTSPHMFVVDRKGIVVYAGAIDDHPSTDGLGKVNYVRQALDELLAGKPITIAQSKPYGCNVKYAR